MCLTDLNNHLSLIKDLTETNELLTRLKSSALTASSYDGMPHAPGAGDKVGALAVKLAELETKVDELQRAVDNSKDEVLQFIDSITDNRTNLIFYLRYICGYEWRNIANMIGGGNTENGIKCAAYRYLHSQRP